MLKLEIMQGISIVLTSYNYAQYISEAIESVLNQDFTNWELIIVDDGSTDNSLEIIQQYTKEDARIKLYQHKDGVNKGLAESIKLGLSNCSNEWVVFLESDDILQSESLRKRLEVVLADSNIDLVFSNFETIGTNSISEKILDYIKERQDSNFSLEKSGIIKNYSQLVKTGNIILTFSIVMVRKSVLKKCDFNSPIKAFLDYFLWSQFADKNIYYLAEKLTYWRMHSDSYMNRTSPRYFERLSFELKRRSYLYKNKNILLKVLLMLNCIRVQIVHVKKTPSMFRINFLNDFFIWDIKRN